MKKFILWLFLLPSINCFAQKDYCNDIAKKVDEFKETTTYESPNLGPRLNIQLTKTVSKEHTYQTVVISFNSEVPDYDPKGVFLKLDDNTILKDINASTHCSLLGGTSYFIIGVLSLDTDMIDNISKHKITKLRIGSSEKDVNDKIGIKIMSYAPCIFSSN